MSKHKSEDYKLSAVKYHLNNEVSLNDVYDTLQWTNLEYLFFDIYLSYFKSPRV